LASITIFGWGMDYSGYCLTGTNVTTPSAATRIVVK
jgi:hypothetical protein